MTTKRVGRLAIVLHTHSPWLLGYGTWPVGEEWLRQAWAQSYVRLIAMLRSRADQGERNLLTLGVTPVLAAQWDNPDAVSEQARWIADWRVRATGKALQAQARGDGVAADDAHRHFTLARWLEEEFAATWSSGGSAALRPLLDAGVIDHLGGPIAHSFTPHLIEPFRKLALESGLRDSHVRLGTRPTGLWAPECAYVPGLEDEYARHGITHVMVDGPTVLSTDASIHRPLRIGDSDVYAFARDLSVTYRVWSPRRGYPGNEWYQDFHDYDHEWGLKPSRVTKRHVPTKAPYEPHRAAAQVQIDAQDFLNHARQALLDSSEHDPLVVVAYDTELFGHWWHEGPEFLAAVMDKARDAGIELTTLSAAREYDANAASRALPAGSWGSGKDFRVWESGEAGDVMRRGRGAQYAVGDFLKKRSHVSRSQRDYFADAVLTELFLALASDWAFMITKDSAADYARGRIDHHCHRVAQLLRDDHHGNSSSVRDTRLPYLDARQATITRHQSTAG